MYRTLAALVMAMVSMVPAPPLHAAEPFRLQQEVVVPGPGAAFDYVTYDSGRLYVGHRPLGLDVFDVRAGFALTKVPQTAGSNGATLMPEFGLGVSNNQNGTLTVFGLADLAVRGVVKVADELDSSRYDPVTRRVAVTGIPAARGKSSVAVLQAPAMDRVGAIEVDSAKLEHPVADGEGGIFVAAQDSGKIIHLDLRALQVTGSLPTQDCAQPTGLDYDRTDRRLYVGCRGTEAYPRFLVLDAADGRVVFRGQISPGNDDVLYDPARRLAFAANGIGANLVVFERTGPDDYRLAQVLWTRPAAKTLAYDPAAGTLYSITAEPVFNAPQQAASTNPPYGWNAFLPDTFRILAFGR